MNGFARASFLLVTVATAALAQSGFYPSIIRVGAIAGSSAPVSVSVGAYSSGADGSVVDYSLSVQYGGTGGWLSFGLPGGTTPSEFVIIANPANLPAGVYTAMIVGLFGKLNGSATATVQFTVAPGGANPEGLAANPSSVVFLPDSTGPQDVTISNSPGVSGILPFTVSAASTGWLGVTQLDQTTPATLRLQADTSRLRPGTHFGSITVTSPAGKSTVMMAVAVVKNAAAGQTISLTPAQQALTFNYQAGTTSNPWQTEFVSTASTQYTGFTASTSDPWLGVSAASWIIPARSAACFAPGLFYVAVDPTGLPAGVYRGKVTLSGGGSSVDVPVTLTVSLTPVLNANPSFVSLDAATSLLSSNIAVAASDSFFMTASVSAGAGWLSVSPSTAVASNNLVNLTVSAAVSSLPGGTYNATITLAGPNGSPSLAVPVQLTIPGGSAANPISATPGDLKLAGIAGDIIPPQYVGIANAFGVPDPFAISAVAEGGWLTVDPSIGSAPAFAKVAVNPATPAGSYAGSLVVTSLTTGDQATVNVKLDLTARAMIASPATLTFTRQAGGPAPASQEAQITANAPSSFRVSSQPSWIKIQAAGPLTTPAKLVIGVDTTGLAIGQYQDSIQLSGPNTVVIPVALTITAPPPPAVAPMALAFAHQLGSPAPAAQSVSVTAPAGSTTFTAAASTTSGVEWLAATPSTGTTPGTITVTVNVAHLTPGRHEGALTLLFASNPGAPVTVDVSLTVTGAGVQVWEILNAASGAPTSVSPGQIVTLTGLGLGPATPVAARPAASGAFGTELAGVRVFFDDMAAPLLYVQDSQINAIVPYALSGRASVRLQVQADTNYSIPVEVNAVSAAPGIFTAGSSGRGQAAALNADSTVNSPLNPAQRGSVIVVYLTGEGQTDPPGQDGRVIASDLRTPLANVTARIGGAPAEVLYAGSAPLTVSGVCQVNLRIPQTIDAGTQPVEISIGGAPSQRGVTIELR